MTEGERLPFAGRRAEHAPGHWLLARLGKRVLRPGGQGLTRQLIEHARVAEADVVELAPGLGRTAAELCAGHPRSYVGVEKDEDAARLTERAVGTRGRVVNSDAADTGLPDASADVVIGEALLQMRRNLADEGVGGTLRIIVNLVRDPDARRRVLAMRSLFRRHQSVLRGFALVAVKPDA